MKIEHHDKRRTAIILTGATGVGKTELSLGLAEAAGAEIISVDSRLVYRGMDIGTAKPTRAERDAVPHHLIDIIDPGERFTVSDFMRLGLEAAEDIFSRNKAPLFVGGTCMYINALRKGFTFAGVDRDAVVRRELETRADADGVEAMHARLAAVDPASAARIHANDRMRILRALEIFEATGLTMTQRNAGRRGSGAAAGGNMDFLVIGVCRPRNILLDRINKRVDSIYNDGLVEEAGRVLSGHPGAESFFSQVIGYAQALDVLKGSSSEAEARGATAKATRDFAKRQLTWFRRMKDITWLNLEAVSANRGIEVVLSALNKTNYSY